MKSSLGISLLLAFACMLGACKSAAKAVAKKAGQEVAYIVGREVGTELTAMTDTSSNEERQKLAFTENAKNLFGDNELSEIYVEEFFPVLMSDEAQSWAKKMAHRGMSTTETEAAGAELSSRGMTRLPTSQIKRVMELRSELAQLSSALCAGFWTGKASQNLLFGTLAKLPLDHAREWFRISAEAMRAELTATAPIDPISESESIQAFSELMDAASKAEQRAILDAVAMKSSVSPELACNAVTAFHANFRSVRPSAQKILARAVLLP